MTEPKTKEEAFCEGFAYGCDYEYTGEYPEAGKLLNRGGRYIMAKILYDKIKSVPEEAEK